MPIGICPHCRRGFVVEAAWSFQRTCPGCLHPMELPAAAAPAALSALAPSSSPPSPLGEQGVRWLGDTPVVADELGQRLLTVLAEAACEHDRARAQRQRARELRRKKDGERAAADALAGNSPGAAPPVVPGRGSGSLLERARVTCLEARMTAGRVRVSREKRQFSRDPLSLLPPLEYKLLPPHRTLPLLSEAARADADHLEAPPELEPPLPAASSTALYVWGYAPPASPLCRDQCAATEAAARVARQNEWEEERPGAWAKEIRLGLSLSEMLRLVVPILREDPGVEGWQMTMQRGEGLPDERDLEDGEP